MYAYVWISIYTKKRGGSIGGRNRRVPEGMYILLTKMGGAPVLACFSKKKWQTAIARDFLAQTARCVRANAMGHLHMTRSYIYMGHAAARNVHVVYTYCFASRWPVYCNYVAICYSVLQCVAVCCSVLQCVTVYCSALQCAAWRCRVLQCIAVSCSELQCVAL